MEKSKIIKGRLKLINCKVRTFELGSSCEDLRSNWIPLNYLYVIVT